MSLVLINVLTYVWFSCVDVEIDRCAQCEAACVHVCLHFVVVLEGHVHIHTLVFL